MSKGAIAFSQDNEYYTPKYIVEKFGPFDYDPATTREKAEEFGIPHYDTIETDGLAQDWTLYRRIWINPPFTLKHKFFEKAVETFDQTVADIFFFCPIEFLTTRRFHNALGRRGGTLYLPNGRIKFQKSIGQPKSPAFGSVIFNLATGGIKVKLMEIL